MKISIVFFLLIFSIHNTKGQCKIDDYLLNTINQNRNIVENTYSDTSLTTIFNHYNKPQTHFENQREDKIDAYCFTLKYYPCLKNIKTNYCSIYYRKNRQYFIEISLFFNLNDSLICKSTFEKIITESKIETKYPIISSGTSKDLVNNLTKPYFEYYKNEYKKESIIIYYRKTSNEYELTIKYINKSIIDN